MLIIRRIETRKKRVVRFITSNNSPYSKVPFELQTRYQEHSFRLQIKFQLAFFYERDQQRVIQRPHTGTKTGTFLIDIRLGGVHNLGNHLRLQIQDAATQEQDLLRLSGQAA